MESIGIIESNSNNQFNVLNLLRGAQLEFNCSKSTIEMSEQCAISDQS